MGDSSKGTRVYNFGDKEKINMIRFTDETIINASSDKVFYFLTHIDRLYKKWHSKDHIFCHALIGSLDRKGSMVHFFEWIGHFPLYLIAQISKVDKDHYIEYLPVFPFSLLRLGYGSFTIEKISNNEIKLVAYVEGGYNIPVIGSFLDFIVRKLISFDAIKKHMNEEGENIKRYLEKNSITIDSSFS